MLFVLGMKRKLIIGFIFITACVTAQEVSKTNYITLAQYWEKTGDILAAAYFYKEAFAEQPVQSVNMYYHYADLCRQIYHYTEAETYYEKVCLSDSIDNYPQAWFYLSLVQKNNAKYKQATASLKKYQRTNDANDILQQRTIAELAFLENIEEKIKDTLWVQVEKAPTKINTEYSEFNAYDHAEGIYFSALRPLSDNKYSNLIDQYVITQIYVAPYIAQGVGEAYSISSKINDSRYHNCHFCFNKDQSKIYFSRCLVNDKQTRYSIWTSTIDDNGHWSKPQKLNTTINQEQSSNSNPYLLELEQYDILYFVSDRAGGYGGKDIWYSIIENEEISEPVNAGAKINTAGNETTPFYQLSTHRLYFSSDFHPGFGGMDIFYSEGELSSWSEVKNAGYLLNSPANETHFVFNETDSSGYFSSNRKGSFYYGEESCCDDIYSFELKPDTLIYYCDTLLAINHEEIEQNIQQLLPITLYFHNDEPNPRSMDTTTTIDYKTTLQQYVKMIGIYQAEYSKGLKDKERGQAKQDIEDFFIQKVEYGLQLLDQVKQWLLIDLQQGNDVTMTVTGFASPLFSDKYNTNLSSRRIVSFENYICNQPEFKPYIGKTLHFIRQPKGKSLAAKYVSDNPNDKRNSVYSISAALERRIQLTEYQSIPSENKKYLSAVMLPAAKTITIKKQKNIDVYDFCFEIKNIGNEELIINSVTSTLPEIKLLLDEKIIKPHGNTLLHIYCRQSDFFNRKTGIIEIKSNTQKEEIEVILE